MTDDLKDCIRERDRLWNARQDLTEDQRIDELAEFCAARGFETWEVMTQ